MIRRLLLNQRDEEKIAVITDDKAVTYGELLKKARQLRPLLPLKRENIAILLPNGGDYIAAFWGALMAGMTAFPINTRLTGHEIAAMLRHADVGTVITAAPFYPLPAEIAANACGPLNIIRMDELAPDAPAPEAAADFDPMLPMVLLGTSGTTGSRKIVQLSERNMETTVMGYSRRMHFDQPDIRLILAVPFSSVYGLMLLSVCLLHSFPVIPLESNFTLDAFYRLVEKHKATHYEGSASAILLMQRLAGRRIPHDIASFRYMGFGGSPVSGATIEAAQAAYAGIEFFQGYGMTEAASLIAKHPLGKLIKTNAVGTAIDGVEIAVAADGIISTAPYVSGEIVVRGHNVMLGYYKNAAETGKAIKNGYLFTGDMGYLDDEGYLYLCGRKKNVIIVRGYNVYPEEVEDCLLQSGLVSDCRVFAQQDAFGNETVCADIVPQSSGVTAEEIQSYCRSRLAEYKLPQKIRLRADIPKNASGKTERKAGGE